MKRRVELELLETTNNDRKEAEITIREAVFVKEQGVDPSIEYDEFEDSSKHYVLKAADLPVGCARYRWVGPDIKLERLAVLKEERGKGYGTFIMKRLLEISLGLKPRNIYLHSQITAKRFYERFGFEASGPVFREAEIDHVKMHLRNGDHKMEGAEQVPERGAIDDVWKWDLTPLYGSSDEWEKVFGEVESEYPYLSTFRGKLSGSNKNIVEYIIRSDELSRKLERIFTWAHLKHDENLNDTYFQSLHDRAINLMTRIETETSFFVPELLSFSKEKLQYLLEDPSLEFARVPLRSMIRQKDHFLNESEERLMAMAQEALEASSKTFGMLNDADLKFPDVKDEDGKEVELSHGRFISMLLSRNREVRRDTLKKFYSSYNNHRNTFASLIEGELKSRAFRAKARNYPSALHASLDSDEVKPDIYNSLIDAVHSRLPDFYRYVDLRRKALRTDDLHMYDVYVSLIDEFEKKVSFDEAREIVLEALKPLGDEIFAIVREGLSSGWIDVFENRGKRSGAYSSGCYDSPPFILMNYENNIREVFTLAHEMGHSVHTYLANRSQPHLTSDYRIFVAEVASTVNEILLLYHLKKVWTGRKEQAYLVNHHLESFKGTVFRQTMFAEFERDIQEMVEKGTPLTPDILAEHYGDLNRNYFGPRMIIDDEIKLEWARIPHFYYNFYVYKYATSFCAANAIARRILGGDMEQLERYIGMLKAGGSKPPVDLLIEAGVDLRTPEPVKEALEVFSSLVDEMDRLL